MNTVLWLATLLTIYSVVDNESPSSVQLLTKLQLFLYVYFHFYHEKSNSRVLIYEYGLAHCLTGFGLLDLHYVFPAEYLSLFSSDMKYM